MRIVNSTDRSCDIELPSGTWNAAPAFTADAEGKPLHSWRVLILPYLGDESKALYEKIRLDEPWDSEYDKQFHALMPLTFRCPSNEKCGPSQTAYSVTLGKEALFDASGKGKDLNALRTRQDIDVRQQTLIV